MTRERFAAGDAGLRERKQVLDDAWLLMLLGVTLAVGAPWFLRTLPIDTAPVTWAVFAYGAAYLAISRLVDRLRGARALLNALTAMQGASVVFLAFLWHLVGGLQNPMFLLVFAIPIAATGCMLPGARAFAVTFLAIAGVAAVALANAPELRWYLTQLGVPAAIMPTGTGLAARPFPGLDLPAAYLFLALLTFAGLALALALVAHSVALMGRRLETRLEAAARAAGDASSLAGEVLRAIPFPAALVYADTRNVAQASERFLQRLNVLPESLSERDLFGLVEFTYPEVVAEAIARGSGDIGFAVYRAGGVSSAARIHVSRVEHAGTGYVLLVIEDIAERFTLQAAMGAVTSAVVVIGADDRVRYFNPAAAKAMPGLELGVHAATPLGQADAGGWWRLGERAHRERQVVLSGQPFDARCVAANAPGRQDHVTVVELTRAAA